MKNTKKDMALRVMTFVTCGFLPTAVNGAILAWTSVNTTTSSVGAPTTELLDGTSYTFNNDEKVITGIDTAQGAVGFLQSYDIVSYVDGTADGDTVQTWYQRDGDNTSTILTSEIANNVDEIFGSPYVINRGSDTTTSWLDSLAITNLTGFTITNASQLTDLGVTIGERGGNDEAGFRLVTAIDGAGAPTAYSTVATVQSSDWGTSNNTRYINFSNGDTSLVGPYDEVVNNFNAGQSIGGLVATLDEFSVNVGDTIYGYELTSSVNDEIDFINVGGLVSVTAAVPEPTSALLGSLGLFALLRRRR